MYISVNGRITEDNLSQISSSSEAFLFGYGAFETIKFEEKKIYFLREHYYRLKKACEVLLLSIEYDLPQVEGYIKELIEKNQVKRGALKVLYAKNKNSHYLHISIRRNNYDDEVYKKGFRVGFTNILRNPYSLLTYIKSNNYMENLIVKNQALKEGFDEAIFENFHGDICEGTISNVFFVKDKRIFTPKTECGLLAGIMRDKVIEVAKKEGLNVSLGNYRKKDLLEADEIFLSNSLMEIMPVSKLENKKFNIEKNSITKELMSALKTHIDL